MSAFLTNWVTAIVLYLPLIFFPDVIWFGLAPILFGHVPIAICYIHYITVNNLASGWDYLIGTVIMVLWYVVGVRIIINKTFEDVNSPYPFDEVEMNKFKN